MDILQLFEFFPDWLKGALAVFIVQGLLFYRVFNGYIKMTKQANEMKELVNSDQHELFVIIRKNNKDLNNKLIEHSKENTELRLQIIELTAIIESNK